MTAIILVLGGGLAGWSFATPGVDITGFIGGLLIGHGLVMAWWVS